MLRIRKKHPLAIRWFHWLNFPLLAVMIWSGLLIYWANDVYSVKAGSIEIVLFPQPDEKHPKAFNFYAPTAPDWYPGALADHVESDSGKPMKVLYRLNSRLAEGMAWHFFFMWFFTINGLLYVLFTAFSGQWRHLLPGKGSLKNAWQTILHDMHLRKEPPPVGKYNGAQQITYSLIVVMGLGSLLTGLAIYKPTQLGWLTALFGGYGAARFIHFWLMIGYVGFFTVHIIQVIRAGWNNFRGMITGHELYKETESGEVVASA